MRTPILNLFKRIVSQSQSSLKQNNNSVDNSDRRKFIKNSSLAALGIGISSSTIFNACINNTDSDSKNEVFIIGGGIAGLHAGYLLKKKGISFKILESSNRTGGRIFTVNDLVVKGTSSELGGEFIDSNHEDMLNLVKEFDLKLIDLEEDSKKSGLIKDTYFFSGKHYKESELIEEFSKYSASIAKDIQLVVEEEDENAFNKFDLQSIDSYLREKGLKGWLFDMLTNAFTGEMGIDSKNQSVLNMLYMLDADTSNGFKMYGESDERFKIQGGNSLLIEKLSNSLSKDIILNTTCVKIEQKPDGYKIHTKENKVYTSQYIIIAIPFTALRKVDLAVELPEEKRNAINNLSYGASSKLILGFKDQLWRKQGYSGYLFSDKIQNGWDSSITQNPNQLGGAFTIFLGGSSAISLDESMADSYMSEFNKVFPGALEKYNNNKSVFNWAKNSLVEGGYSAYTVGQWSTIAGNEQTPVGNIYFAGEHCSENFQGYMNGGAETGRVAAESIIQIITESKSKK